MTDGKIPPAVARLSPVGELSSRQRRRLLLELSVRRQAAGTGSSHDLLQRRTAMNPWPDLREILGDIPWAIVGGVATRGYMPERVTQDLDIMVLTSDGDEAIARLRAAGFTLDADLTVPGHTLRSPGGVEVDVLFGDMPWLETALAEPRRDPAGFPILDLPYLVLTKLAATRAQDVADITRMLGLATDEELDRVRAVVARNSPEDSEDLETLIYLGKLENEPKNDSI